MKSAKLLVPMSDTQKIKEKLDIVDFVGEYVGLKPAGINHKGLCPFHSEKSPSFMVNRDRQSWHCFGCSKGGDIFSFVQEIEGMEFFEALKFLAQRAGIQLELKQQNQVQTNQKNRLKEIHTEAARFYYKFLTELDASKLAREYLERRGVTPETIDEWQIGFIPDQWELLTKYLLKKGFSINDLVASGLTIKRDNANARTGKGFYDRFRGRVMFPIRDLHGTVVGFTGRILVEGENTGGKYVNSPQTLIYDKSRIMFGLDKAKQDARKKDCLMLVEGQLDVISSHQAGLNNVVATSGTALTDEQIKLIKRYTNNVKMAFDSDDAGVAAAKRGIDLALEAGLSVKVINVPDGKDPDDCIRNNPQTWFDAVEQAQDVMSWYFDRVLGSRDLSHPRDKQLAADELLREIARMPYAIEQDHWLKELSGRIGVDVPVLREDLKRVDKKKESPKVVTVKSQTVTKKVDSRLETLAEQYFCLLLKFPSALSAELKHPALKQAFSTTRFNTLYEAVENQYTNTGSLDTQVLRNTMGTDNTENIVDVLLMKAELDFLDITEQSAKNEAIKFLEQIKKTWKQGRRKQIELAIVQAEQSGDKVALQRLLEEFQSLQE